MINFDSIKDTLVEKGLAYKDMADAATQKVVVIEGEWNRDGSATITEKKAGWVIGSFPKCVRSEFEVPQTSNFDKDAILNAVQCQFPDAKIIVQIL